MAERSPLLLLSRQLVPRGLPRSQRLLGSLRPGGYDDGRRAPYARQEHANRQWGTVQIRLEHPLRHIFAR